MIARRPMATIFPRAGRVAHCLFFLAPLLALLLCGDILAPAVAFAAGRSHGSNSASAGPGAPPAPNVQPIGSGPETQVSAPSHPQSPQVSAEYTLFWIVVALAFVILALIFFLVFMNWWKFSGKPGDHEEPRQVYGNRFIEVSWTLIPGAILLITFAATAIVINKVDLTPKVSAAYARQYPPVTVQAIGHQWWWEFKYPSDHFITANELHVPVHSVITVQVTSVDVIHAFMIPQMTRQMDATPNNLQTIFFQANHTGVYPGDCYEYCGDGHAWMQFRVVVQTQQAYRAWVKHMQQPAANPTGGPALAGEQLFMSATCANCHNIDGTPANGTVGPDLTHVASRWGIAGGVLPMGKQYLADWINHTEDYKPGVLMPQFQLNQRDLNDLATYLAGLK